MKTSLEFLRPWFAVSFAFLFIFWTPQAAAASEPPPAGLDSLQAAATPSSYFLALQIPSNVAGPLMKSEKAYEKLIRDKFGNLHGVTFHPRGNLHISLLRLGSQDLSATQQKQFREHFVKYPRKNFNLRESMKKTWFDVYAGSGFLVYEIGYSEDLENLAKAITKALRKSYKAETRHISIAWFSPPVGDSLRYLEKKGKPLTSFCHDDCADFSFNVSRFVLMKSIHAGDKRTYVPEACFNLDGSKCTLKKASSTGMEED